MKIRILPERYPFRFLVLSDTHIYHPNPVWPEVFLREAEQTDLILHCGDICMLSELEPLRKFAPVYCVRGNRDLRDWFKLPGSVELDIDGFRVQMTHGEGWIHQYLGIKAYDFNEKRRGRVPDRFRLNAIEPDYADFDLCLLGHSHYPSVRQLGHTVIANPGHLITSRDCDDERPLSFITGELTKESLNLRTLILDPDFNIASTEEFVCQLA